jgi:hypothetical protein
VQGLQIFDENGKQIFFSNTFTTTYVYGTRDTTTEDDSITDSRIVAGRTWIIITEYLDSGITQVPSFTVSNGRISWENVTYQTGANGSQTVNSGRVRFMYGGF